MKGSIGVGFNPKSTYREQLVEDAMSRKVNVTDPRNGFELRRMGDKAYRYAEHSSDYFFNEGILPGTTGFGLARTTQRRGGNLTKLREYNTANLILRPNMTDHNKLEN